jgi:uncharacterized protein YbjT (DUF2867 family)
VNVWLIGGTGLAGSGVRERLRVRDGVTLTSLVRRAVPGDDMLVVDFDDLVSGLAGRRADVAISCLGSTIRKAGSWERFRAIDTGYVLAFAMAAKAAGARQFIHVSSVGAQAGAKNRYLAMKGETEAGLARLGFERLDILRPGLLLGARREFRLAERIGAALSPALSPLLRGKAARYRGIAADEVSRAIAALAGRPETGRFVHFNPEIERLSR